jgi:transcriptional regulator with XRE-family HTH domain
MEGRVVSSKENQERIRLGARLKEAREYLALSQEEVAQALNLPRSAISLIETGQRRVDALELKKLAALYKRSTDHFTGEEANDHTLPESVKHLARIARTASALKDRDREELLRFAEFLKSKMDSEKQ